MAGVGATPMLRTVLRPIALSPAQQAAAPDVHLVGTDGWIYLPPAPAIPPYHPDVLAPAPYTTYMFGFRDVTGLTTEQIQDQKMKAQASAPLLWADEGVDYRIQLSNLGLAMRPDLTDSHTVHWHGFRNAIPMFDGEPSSSVAVPINRDLTYFYRPREPGTYMYHCHFEDTEHVHMGMTGTIFIRPAQNGNTALYPSGKYAYNDGDGSTGYDREYAMFLSEVWAESHWADAHIQLPEWSDYRPDFYLLNGRVYPDTLEANFDPMTDYPSGSVGERLRYQPISSLVQANAGERVLLRFANLGFKQQSMTLAGLKLRVVGKDATLLRGRDGTDISYETNTIVIGAGESVDAIFTAPPVAALTTYRLYNRNLHRLNTGGGAGYGGQLTDVRIVPSGLPAQIAPNT
jgi:FtsP/CotA-like multicopper oxidase with cupredoxin domain